MRQQKTDRGAIDTLKTHFSRVQIADKDEDLDRDPYIAAAWNPITLSNGAAGTIDWVATFGLPEMPKLVFVQAAVRDAASTGGNYYIDFKAKSTTTLASFTCKANRAVDDHANWYTGLIPVQENGTSYYLVTASGVNTMDVWVRVVACIK